MKFDLISKTFLPHIFTWIKNKNFLTNSYSILFFDISSKTVYNLHVSYISVLIWIKVT